MGTDHDVIQAARVSFGQDVRANRDAFEMTPSDQTLLRYLLRHHHTTPLEMVEFKFLIRCPMDVWRQWIRHRTASVNEYSTRYKPAIDSMNTVDAEQWRAQSKNNKQGSSGLVETFPENWRFLRDPKGEDFLHVYIGDVLHQVLQWDRDSALPTPQQWLSTREEWLQNEITEVYKERLKFGVANELARKDLPLSNYTEAYWKIDLHNLLNFLRLRMDSHAQQEIREFANAIGNQIVKQLCPVTWGAFEDYCLNSMQLSANEVTVIYKLLENLGVQVSSEVVQSLNLSQLSGREFEELQAKLTRIGLMA
jgi:thymidylate synthase (FAD)